MLGKHLSSSDRPSRPSNRQATSSPEEGELDDDPSLALPPRPPPQAQPLAHKVHRKAVDDTNIQGARYPAPAMTKVRI
ncbi:hypothetical protein M422DRAFT_244066 [Sphaerobolus stellatus SS14]|nr:hypothetical protein M422DRAFT_244066 [Sphaerobolus stellatus SS14]